MRRILLTVAYDGTAYHGWQVQPNGNTIQAELEHHLGELLGERVTILGASRTDAGVHARGNVAVFDTSSRMPARKVALAVNTRLPSDIRVQWSAQVPLSFHPRFQETEKTYAYRICNRPVPDPMHRLYTLFYYWKLDEQLMRKAAACLVGTHDFSSFCTHRPEVTDHVRTIRELRIEREGDLITVWITGNGFLYHMVRIIVGTLLRIGSGQVNPEQMERILAAKDRDQAFETARPEGLTLERIRYPGFPELEIHD